MPEAVNDLRPSDLALQALEERCASIAGRVDEATTPDARAALKREIVELFRQVDDVQARVGALRERLRGLAKAYRGGGTPRADGGGRQPVVYTDELNSSSFVQRGWNLIAAEKYAEAVQALEKALAFAPGNVEAEGLLGWALIKEERYDRALGCLQRVLLAEPANEMARVNLGFLCLKRRIYGEALEHLAAVAAAGRDRKATLYALLYLGLLHAERDETGEALTFLRRAIEAGPNLIEAYYHMGVVLYRTGKAEQARAVWESAVERNQYNPYSRRARALLQDLDAGHPLALS